MSLSSRRGVDDFVRGALGEPVILFTESFVRFTANIFRRDFLSSIIVADIVAQNNIHLLGR